MRLTSQTNAVTQLSLFSAPKLIFHSFNFPDVTAFYYYVFKLRNPFVFVHPASFNGYMMWKKECKFNIYRIDAEKNSICQRNQPKPALHNLRVG